MEIKKVSQFENMIKPEGNKPQAGVAGAPSFQETLNKLGNTSMPSAPLGLEDQIARGIQAKALTTPAAADGVKFSNHAVERMQSRGISFDKDAIGKLNEAVGRAAAKGSKDTLVLMNEAALIVSVKNKTVVTVMDKAALKENVFTNIDSTIVM